jgi:hypothetical protein
MLSTLFYSFGQNVYGRFYYAYPNFLSCLRTVFGTFLLYMSYMNDVCSVQP